MKNLFPKFGLCLFLIAVSVANAGVPPVNVTVSDSTGKAAFKGTTKADGGFATAKLQPGKYIVQFTARSPSMKGGPYSIVVAAGKKKVVADALAGERFRGGGVAMRVEVGAGLNIIGQVWAGSSAENPSSQKDLGKMQDRGQDTHQAGYRSSTSQLPDKMFRP